MIHFPLSQGLLGSRGIVSTESSVPVLMAHTARDDVENRMLWDAVIRLDFSHSGGEN